MKKDEIEFKFIGEIKTTTSNFGHIYQFLKDVGIDVSVKNSEDGSGATVTIKKLKAHK